MRIIAQVTVKEAAEFTPAGLTEVVKWLHECADDLAANAKSYAPEFNYRYYVPEKSS